MSKLTQSFVNKIRILLPKSNSRNALILKNVSLSASLKIVSIIISFIIVPISLSYLSKVGYGLWVALSSVLSWFFIFDIGVGNGLRNKFIEFKAKKQSTELKYLISTAYFLFVVFAVIIIMAFVILNYFIDWTTLLNAPSQIRVELNQTVFVVFIALILSFVLKLMNNILNADLKNWIGDLLTTIGSIVTLLGVIFINSFTKPSLVNFAIVYTGSNLLANLVGSIVLFNTIYKEYRPSYKFIDFQLRFSLLSVGLKFFVLQVGSLILFQTSGLILSNLVGPESVADYNINMKYYSATTMVFMFIWQPLWTGYGDAYYRQDFDWIRNTLKRLRKIWVGSVLLMCIMLIFQKYIFQLWLNNKIDVNYNLSFLFIIYYALQIWQIIHETFITATSKLKLSLIISAIFIPLYIPFTIYLVKYLKLEAMGVLIALVLINGIPNSVLSWLQTKKILNNATGIWNK